jgi:TatD DNase family protein
VHPCSVNNNYKKELQQVKDLLQARRFPAVGEIGLDFYWSTEFINQQYEAFEIQMQWALERKLPVVIHTRNAMQQTIDFCKTFCSKGFDRNFSLFW